MFVFVSRFTRLLLPLQTPQLSMLNRFLSGCVAVCLVASLWMSHTAAAWADGPSGGELFEIHCAGCHLNGANIIRRGKNLKQKALKRYGYESADAIATLITNGKGLMSAYDDRLSQDEIASLASYVLEQAAINWKPTK